MWFNVIRLWLSSRHALLVRTWILTGAGTTVHYVVWKDGSDAVCSEEPVKNRAETLFFPLLNCPKTLFNFLLQVNKKLNIYIKAYLL